MAFAFRKPKESPTAVAEAIGGHVGWPTETWLKGKRLYVFSPLGQLGSKSAPVSGTVSGRPWTSFRIRSTASRTALRTTASTTCRHTAVVLPDAVRGLPVFSIISRHGGWERFGIGRTVAAFATGDPAFDAMVLVAAAPEHRQRVLALLTDDVKDGVRAVVAADQSAFIKIAGDTDMLMCWINGVDARDAHFPPLLGSLACLADVIETADDRSRRTV